MAVLKDLIVHGPSRFLNGINVNKVEADAIKADSGYFNQLIATSLEAKNAHIDELTANNATVFGVMDVKGKLQTNQWEAASIANVGGNFYISPTGKSATGTITITRTTAASGTTSAKYSVTMSGTFGVSTTSSTIWANGAYGMATGNVSIGTKKYPLGTCDGPLSGISTGTNTITGFTISSIESSALDLIFDENTSLISSNAISNQSGTDLQVSVYLGKSGNNYMPVGILLTSYGKDNKQYIDIYDGEHSAGTAITGFANPVVRIGDLSGLNSYTQSGKYTITPTGWGIYTENGFFNGAVYSELGYIGGWTIGGTNLHNPPTRTAWNTNASGIWIATDVIAGGAQTGSAVSGKYAATDPKWYIKANGDVKFGELTYINGTLSVPAAKVSGKLTAATIDGGQITAGTMTVDVMTTDAANSILNSRYITSIDNDNGIQIHAVNNPSTNYVKINASGMEVFQNVDNVSTSIAEFGIDDNDEAISRIGPESDKNVLINSSGVNIRNASTTLANFTGTGASFSTSSLQNAVKIRAGVGRYNQLGGQIAFGGSDDNTITGTSKNGYSDLAVILETGIETGNPHTVHGIGFRANSTANGKYAWLDLNPEEGSTIESHTSTGKGASLILDNDGGVSLLAYNSSNEGAIWINPTSISLSVPVTMERSAPRIDLIDESTEQTLRILANSNGNKGLFFPTSDTASSSNYWLIRSDVDGDLYLGKAPIIGSHSSPIGEVLAANKTQNIATGTSFVSTGCKINLKTGIWVVIGSIEYAANATGRRGAGINANGNMTHTQVNVVAGSNATTRLMTAGILEISSSDIDVYIYGYQNSGVSLSQTTYMRAVRIR